MFDPDYELFAAVVTHGSLSAGGRSLGISPAMVSKRIARLEARLGARLLHRTTRRFAVTDAGEQLHAAIIRIAAEIAEAERRVQGRDRQLHGTLRISAPTSFGRLHVAPHLGAFLDANPGLNVTLDLSDAFVDLIEGKVDVAIRIASEIPSGLVGHLLGSSGRILCAAPAYIAAYGAPADIAALDRHRLLAADSQLPWRLSRGGRLVLVNGHSRVRTNSSEVVRELCLAGAGIALRSLWDVGGDLREGRLLRILPSLEGAADTSIFAVHPRVPNPPMATAAFIAHLTKRYGPQPPWQLA